MKTILGGILAALIAFNAALAADQISVSAMAFRTGPNAAAGVLLADGQKDYFAMINARDGGANGVPFALDECEAGSSLEKAAQCAVDSKGTVLLAWPAGAAIAALGKSNSGPRPVFAPGQGISAMADGKLFQWAFNPPATALDGASMLLNHVSGGKPGELKGKSVILLHLDDDFGREPIGFLQAMAAKLGFTFSALPVGLKEMQNQPAQWQAITGKNPDFVLLWGIGAMNEGALAEAVKAGFPLSRVTGFWWSANDAELAALGEAAKGFRALSWNRPSLDAPVLADLAKYAGGGAAAADRRSVFYQRGVLISAMLTEAVKTAQGQFSQRQVDAAQVRWGLENLAFDAEKLEALGMSGMIAPFSLRCGDHSGHAAGWLLEWDGSRFVPVSGPVAADRGEVAAFEQAAATAFASANAPWPEAACSDSVRAQP